MKLKRWRTDWRPGTEVRLQEQEKDHNVSPNQVLYELLKIVLFLLQRCEQQNVLVDKKLKSS